MPEYTVNDWEYVTLTDSSVSGSLVVPTAVSGSLISEYIDLTSKHVGDVALYIDGFDLELYYATNYDTDWTLVEPALRTEYILTAFDGEFSTEYDIAYIDNLQTEVAYRQGAELNPSNLVGFAKVGYSTIDDGTYTEAPILDGIFVENNFVRIADPTLLPARTNIAITYKPMIPVLTDVQRHLILKAIFKSMDSYLSGITVDFKLNTFVNVMSGVPTFYRRI